VLFFHLRSIALLRVVQFCPVLFSAFSQHHKFHSCAVLPPNASIASGLLNAIKCACVRVSIGPSTESALLVRNRINSDDARSQTAETQTDNDQAVKTEGQTARIMSGDQMSTLLRTTATALLWVVKEMKPTKIQTQVLEQLHTITKIIGHAKHRRNSEPTVAAACKIPTSGPSTAPEN